jgi:hypothetical protein
MARLISAAGCHIGLIAAGDAAAGARIVHADIARVGQRLRADQIRLRAGIGVAHVGGKAALHRVGDRLIGWLRAVQISDIGPLSMWSLGHGRLLVCAVVIGATPVPGSLCYTPGAHLYRYQR